MIWVGVLWMVRGIGLFSEAMDGYLIINLGTFLCSA
jgi:hypothetical protein